MLSFILGHSASVILPIFTLNQNGTVVHEQTETVHEQNGENQTRTEQYMKVMVRAKISILPMPGPLCDD